MGGLCHSFCTYIAISEPNNCCMFGELTYRFGGAKLTRQDNQCWTVRPCSFVFVPGGIPKPVCGTIVIQGVRVRYIIILTVLGFVVCTCVCHAITVLLGYLQQLLGSSLSQTQGLAHTNILGAEGLVISGSRCTRLLEARLNSQPV